MGPERVVQDAGEQPQRPSPVSWPYVSFRFLKWSRSAMTMATGCRLCGTAATFSEKERRLRRPVSVSVDACSWVSAMTRSKPIRAPASLARVVRS